MYIGAKNKWSFAIPVGGAALYDESTTIQIQAIFIELLVLVSFFFL